MAAQNLRSTYFLSGAFFEFGILDIWVITHHGRLSILSRALRGQHDNIIGPLTAASYQVVMIYTLYLPQSG